jgi:hypothetical protein
MTLAAFSRSAAVDLVSASFLTASSMSFLRPANLVSRSSQRLLASSLLSTTSLSAVLPLLAILASSASLSVCLAASAAFLSVAERTSFWLSSTTHLITLSSLAVTCAASSEPEALHADLQLANLLPTTALQLALSCVGDLSANCLLNVLTRSRSLVGFDSPLVFASPANALAANAARTRT